MKYQMPYGTAKISITLPDVVKVRELVLSEQPIVKYASKRLLTTIEKPIQSKSLENLLQSRNPQSITIVVDDHTRKFPHDKILRPLLTFLKDKGIHKKSITILIATGVHRQPTSNQFIELFGKNIVDNYTIKWNDQANSTYKDYGTTLRGTPVQINSIYTEADFKILVTDVTLHYFAGFGGDRKSIFPGVASAASINSNHSLVMQGIYPGQIEHNPIHDDMMEAAQMAGADFVINVSLDAKGNILDIHSGALKFAFLKAVKKYQNKCIVPIQEKADLLILSAGGHPFDGNYQQSMKAVMQCQNAVKFGGKVLYFLKGENGIGIPSFKEYLDKFPSSQSILEHIQTHDYQQGMHNAYYYRKFTEEHDVYYKTELPENYVKNTLGVNYVTNLELTVSKLIQNVKTVYIIRHGAKMMVR